MDKYIFLLAAGLCIQFTLICQPVSFTAGPQKLIRHSALLPNVEPHIAVNPHNGNHMVIVTMVYDSAAESDLRTHIAIFATKDNWRTYKQTDLNLKVGFDPWVAIKNDSQVVVVALGAFELTPRTKLLYYTSNDGGMTWPNNPISLGGTHDHPTMIIDRSRNDRLWLLSSTTRRYSGTPPAFAAYLNYSDDWKKFRDSGSIILTGPGNSNTLTAAVTSKGKVILPFINFSVKAGEPTTASIKCVTTWDGKNFSDTIVMAENSGLRKGFPVMAVDTSWKCRDRRYLLRNSGHGADRSDGLFMRYSDNDSNWSYDVRVDHNLSSKKYIRTAAMAINKNGIVGVVWVDRRNDPRLERNDIYFTISADHGEWFEKEKRITKQSYQPFTIKNGLAANRHPSGGDYMGCVAKPDGSFQIVWADSRAGVFQLYTCNIKVD